LAFLRKKSYEGRAKSNQVNYFHHLIPKVKVEKIEKNTIIYVKVIRVINNLKHIKKRRGK